MKRVMRSSAGYVQIDYSGKGWGSVDVVDQEGWHIEGRVWGMKGYPADAREVLGDCSGLHAAEIDQLVDETSEQFEARGGDETARREGGMPRFASAVFIGIGLVAVAVVAGVVLLITALL